MAIGTGISIRGDRALIDRLRRIEDGTKNLLEVHRRIGVVFVAWGERNFRAGGLERKWPPLKPSTVFGRRKKSSLPLQDTGKLRETFLEFKATPFDMRWGSPSRLAEIHHGGTGPYTIQPKKKKLLVFPHPQGKKTSKKGRGNVLKAEKKGQFTSFRFGGRSKRDFANLTFLFVKEVQHPGLPARPLIPSTSLASQMSSLVINAYVREKLR